MSSAIFLAVAVLLGSSVSFADEASCIKTGKDCAVTDIESPQAEAAYQAGCKAKDYYSCTRLGQFYQVKKQDQQKALTAYESACAGKDAYGCDSLYAAYMELCYENGQKKYCNKKEPKGDYRIMAFLESFNPKYADAFRGHDFEAVWSVAKAEELYKKRVKEKNKKLLHALEQERKRGKRDGANAESLNFDIECLKGKCPEY